MENIPQVPGNQAEVGQNHVAPKAVFVYSFSLKVKYGYISAHNLESEPSKRFAVSISLQNKAIGT